MSTQETADVKIMSKKKTAGEIHWVRQHPWREIEDDDLVLCKAKISLEGAGIKFKNQHDIEVA